MSIIKTCKYLLCDLSIWFSGPLLFLFSYTKQFFFPTASVLPHLYLVLLLFLATLVPRVVLSNSFFGKKIERIVVAICTSLLLAFMWLYYASVIIGLKAWGHIITLDLIQSYLHYIPALLSVLNIPLVPTVLAFIVAYLAILSLVWFSLKHFDWVDSISPALTGTLRGAIALGLGAFVALQVHDFTLSPPAAASEPFSRTMFPGFIGVNFEDNRVDVLSLREFDKKENAARQAYRVNTDADRKNIILIVADALREDHTSIGNYARDTTPFLSALNKQAQVTTVPDMRSVCSESFCGMLGLIASKYVDRLSEHPITLHEVLKMHDYRIHMIMSGDLANFYGLRKFFGNVDSYFDGTMANKKYPNDDDLVLEKIAQLPKWDEKPVMLQIHLLANHILSESHRKQVFKPSSNYGWPVNQHIEKGAKVSTTAVNFYDNGVLRTDEEIHEIVEQLKSKGYLKDSILIVTADHGELLGEHGLFTHCLSLYEEELRIPFILARFGYEAHNKILSNRAPSQIDIAPTLLTELGMNIPTTWMGEPLQKESVSPLIFFQQADDKGLLDRSVPNEVWKYWINLQTKKESAFKLNTDPQEMNNLADQVPETKKILWQHNLLAH